MSVQIALLEPATRVASRKLGPVAGTASPAAIAPAAWATSTLASTCGRCETVAIKRSCNSASTAVGRAPNLLRALAIRALSGKGSEEQLAVTRDHVQQVVEIVGDAGGELADRFQFLGLEQLGFEPLAFPLSHELIIFRGAGTRRRIRRQASGPMGNEITQSGRKILVDGSAGAEVAGQKCDGEGDSKMARAHWHQRSVATYEVNV